MAVTDEPHTHSDAEIADAAPLAPPAPELSPLRVAILLLVLAGAALGVWRLVTHTAAAAARSHAAPVYAPYVDVTLTPTYQFQLPAEDPVSSAYLGFIVSDPASPCTPSWGGYYTLAQADQSLELGARIAQLRRQGGSAMLAFGGRDNAELATACSDPAQLTQAYLTPIQRYGVDTIDLDIEGAALSNAAANARRADAIAQVQRLLALSHRSLSVWLTLPASTGGLTAPGVALVRTMLDAHVRLAGVNVLAMDFGSGIGTAGHMFRAVREALYATHVQVQALWRGAGLASTPAAAWEHLGVTVMLGVNDITDEHFTLRDAGRLVALANREGIRRVSAWSLNRDSECGAAFPVTGIVANNCSGVLQSQLQFTTIFSRLHGTRTARPQPQNPAAQVPQRATSGGGREVSPYPLWQPSAAYVTGYKVVWQGEIYQANWWSQGTAPGSTPADSTTSDPWLLIGPVPASATSFTPQLLAPARQPRWSPATVYRQGQRVSFRGLPYQARWYTRGDQPLDELPGNPSSPWAPLFTAPGEPLDTGIGSGTSR